MHFNVIYVAFFLIHNFWRSCKMLEINWCQGPIVIGPCWCRLWSILKEATPKRQKNYGLQLVRERSRVSRTRSLWKACSHACAINDYCTRNILKSDWTILTQQLDPTSQQVINPTDLLLTISVAAQEKSLRAQKKLSMVNCLWHHLLCMTSL